MFGSRTSCPANVKFAEIISSLLQRAEILTGASLNGRVKLTVNAASIQIHQHVLFA